MSYQKRAKSGLRLECLESRCLLSSVSLVEDLNTESASSSPRHFHEFENDLFFAASIPTAVGTVFRTDGTSDGTFPVLTNSGEVLQARATWTATPFATMDDALYVVAQTPTKPIDSLWKLNTDSRVFEEVLSLVAMNQLLTISEGYYIATDEGLFQFDLTTFTTTEVTTIALSEYALVHDGIIFSGTSGIHGNELFFSDGTPEGTRLIEDIYPGTDSSWPQSLHSDGETVFFRTADRAIWSTDGESATEIYQSEDFRTEVVGTTSTKWFGLEPNRLRVFDRETNQLEAAISLSDVGSTYGGEEADKRLFASRGGIYATDGTPGNTAKLAEFGDAGINARIYQYGEQLVVGNDELWLDISTRIELNDATKSSRVLYEQAFEDGFVFEANSFTSDGVATYTTDGNSLRRLDTRWDNSNFSKLTTPRVVGDLVFVNATHRDGSHRVAVSDGVDRLQGVWRGSVSNKTRATEASLFILDEDDGTLWVSSGQKATRVPDLPRRPNSINLLSAAPHGVFITIAHESDNLTEYDLWFSDGETSEKILTRLPTVPQFTFHSGRRLLFRVDDEIWTTDGTLDGSKLVGTRSFDDRSTELPYILDGIQIGDIWYLLTYADKQSALSRYDSESLELESTLPLSEFMRGLHNANGQPYIYSYDKIWKPDDTLESVELVQDVGNDINAVFSTGNGLLVSVYDPIKDGALWMEGPDGSFSIVTSQLEVWRTISNGGRNLLTGYSSQFGIEVFRLDSTPAIGASGFDQVHEGQTNDASVFLMSKPDSVVTVNLQISEPEVATSIENLTFTPENWHLPQSVALTAAKNERLNDNGTFEVGMTVSTAESAGNYQSVPGLTRTVRVIDRTAGAYREGTTLYVVGYEDHDEINVGLSLNRVSVKVGEREDTFALKRVNRIVVNSGDGDDYISTGGLRRPTRVFSGQGDDTVRTGQAGDKVYLGPGNDVASVNHGKDTVYGGQGDDTINGGDDDDRLYGDKGDDIILGGNANDRILGGAGDDVVDGENQWDTVSGGRGHDLVFGGNGIDVLIGNNGRDLLVAGDSNYNGAVDQLKQIASEWTSARTLEIKIANITDGSGSDDAANAPFFLSRGVTVADDGDADTLFGSKARDWFFANFRDQIEDLNTETEKIS